MLEIKNITKIYKNKEIELTALNDVSINFRQSEFVSILGPSGCGKTTLLNIIGGLDKYTKGDLLIEGKSTKHYTENDWNAYRNNKIGFVFQNYNLIMHQSILANVELALTLSGVSKSERKERAIEALKSVGLEEHLNKKPTQLSGGQMQRVSIARAIVNNPDIILADEPTGALDSETSVQIMDILAKIAKEKLVIMVTHNPDLAASYSDRIINIKDGKIISDSKPCKDDELKSENSKNVNNSSMGLLTALSLSFNNLLTKKGRTLLTTIASSIGIVGIALVMSLSTGVKKYVDDFQKKSSSNEPLMIENIVNDYSNVETTEVINDEKKVDKSKNEISIKNDIKDSYYVTDNSSKHKNNIIEFKKYLDEHKEEYNKYSTNIQYIYDVNPQFYIKNKKGEIEKVSIEDNNFDSLLTNSFNELPTNKNVIDKNYELISGKLPENYNELLLVVDENKQIPLSTLYALGIEDKSELYNIVEEYKKNPNYKLETKKYDYNSLIGKNYKLLLNADYYSNELGYWINKSNDLNYLNQLYDNAIDLNIVGIIKIKDNVKTSMNSGFIGYTHELIEEVVKRTNEKEIVIEQLNSKDVNILTGKTFDGINSSYESSLKDLGIATIDNPSKINIYPNDYKAKQEIKELIEDYNKDKSKQDKIIVTDSIELLTQGISSIVSIISIVLIAFVAISLIVSSIMISIITYISVLERTREIGILRAIGASKTDIKRVFSAETIVEGFISGVLGVLVAFLIGIAINTVASASWGFDGTLCVMPLFGSSILILINIALNVMAGHIPSKIASKKDPIESLRSE